MKSLIIFNPAAGPRRNWEALTKAAFALEKGGWKVEVVETESSDEVYKLAKEAASSGYDAVIAAGGDGTVNGVVNGIVGTETALGVLPLGTGNVWARQLGLTSANLFLGLPDAAKAAEILLESSTVKVDVGLANGRHFLLWCGIGIDALVTEEIESHPAVKRRLGPTAFVAAGVITAITFLGTKTIFQFDGKTIKRRIILAIVSNIRLYGGIIKIAPYARLNDGLLDLCIFKGYRFPHLLHHVYSVFSGRHLSDPSIEMKQVSKLTVRTARPFSIQVDGEPIGKTPVQIEVKPQALKALIPPTCPPELFSRGIQHIPQI
jgi:YegS/Rv2252/BmrU family lipid kinase